MKQLLYILFFGYIALAAKAQNGPTIWIHEIRGDSAHIEVHQPSTSVLLTGKITGLSEADILELFKEKKLKRTHIYERLTTTFPLPRYESRDSTFLFELEGNSVKKNLGGDAGLSTDIVQWHMLVAIIGICSLIIGIMRQYPEVRKGVILPAAFIVSALILCTYADWRRGHYDAVIVPVCMAIITVFWGIISAWRSRKSVGELFAAGIIGFPLITAMLCALTGAVWRPGVPASLILGANMKTISGMFIWFGVAFILGLISRWFLYGWPSRRVPMVASMGE